MMPNNAYKALDFCNVTTARQSQEECGIFGVVVVVTKWLDLGEGRTILIQNGGVTFQSGIIGVMISSLLCLVGFMKRRKKLWLHLCPSNPALSMKHLRGNHIWIWFSLLSRQQENCLGC
jgi:hypothetical protein